MIQNRLIEQVAAQLLAGGPEMVDYLERLECEKSFHSFVREAWSSIVPEPFVDGWHVRAICDHLEAVARGDIKRLVINVSPRSSKTLLVSILWPAWIWCQARDPAFPLIGPQCRFLAVTYAQGKGDEDALRARRLLHSEWYQKHWGFRFGFQPDLSKIEHFANDQGGERISSSFSGSLIGRGGDIKIIDDPHKGGEVESDTVREGVIRDYDESLQTRIINPKTAAEVVVMQRVHQLDLTGHLLEKEDPNTVHLCIPMEYEADRHCITYVKGRQFWEDPRTEDGDPMWPERLPQSLLNPYKSMPYVWSGQFQQRPTPRGGGVIQADWWQNWPPDAWPTSRSNEYPPMEYIVASLDTAFTEKKSNDFTALTIGGIWRDLGLNIADSSRMQMQNGVMTELPPLPEDERAKIMLMYAKQWRLTLHGMPEPDNISVVWEDGCPACGATHMGYHDKNCTDLLLERQKYWGSLEWTVYLCRKFGVHRLLIEDSAAGKPVAQELIRLYQNENFSVELVPVRGDKLARALSIQPLFAAGRVWAPLDRQWAGLVVDQLVALGRTRHDDSADSFVQLLMHLRQRQLAVLPGEEDVAYSNMWSQSRKKRGALYDA